MDVSGTKIYVYSLNKFMIFTIKEVLKDNFNCEVFCTTPPLNKIEEIFESEESDIVLFDADLLFDTKVRDALNRRGSLKVIALVNGEVDYGLRQIISSYADGMIDNTYDIDIIVLIINAVMKGFQCLPHTRTHDNNLKRQMSRLTQREQEVLHYVSQGLPNKSIADFLGVSYKTICVHRYNIMYKLKLNDLSDFARFKTFRSS